MELFKIKKTIPFMKHALLLNLISLFTFLFSMFCIYTYGMNFSIEFTGGKIIALHYDKEFNVENIRQTLDDIGCHGCQVQNFGSNQDVIIKIPIYEKNNIDINYISDNLLSDVDYKAKINYIESIGPQIGEELFTNGIIAMIFVILGIITYLGFRFEWKFAIACVIANLHDVIIILGFFAFMQWDFSLSVLTGILAVLGYSVNESVIIMDRIRENFCKYNHDNLYNIINKSITQTISRTIITHGSTQMMIISILVFGGPSLHYFAIAITIGIWFGIYSSVFISSSLAMWMKVNKYDILKKYNK
ncbi:hypothetical protein CKSOR_00120 [Candidatus Kinetoplastibacterium sorsogonicusi]|uniref:Protein-export membrane protein SecF n=1 Tax=Candidatus Kinetoplastidibacterium kentomonadis TaxID=1576550 RepID=A0A3S7J9B1_9PROT|nr:protein translocase subunit SecF [Candidatus Kinetoplastibacterium sorsogonicusi]AWD32256.1 hypothetical protein CKSOR_00120 [Candidatus Kinetoplastibacterium sorsogonicusi]